MARYATGPLVALLVVTLATTAARASLQPAQDNPSHARHTPGQHDPRQDNPTHARHTPGQHDPRQDNPTHARHARQLHRILDPFGLLEKAGEAMNGAVQGAAEALGKTMDHGAQHLTRMLQDGAKSLDSAFKNHVGQVHAGLEEAGKVATIVSEDLADSVSTLVSNHLHGPSVSTLVSNHLHGPSVSTLVSTHLHGPSEDQVMRREGLVDGFLRMVGIEPSHVGLMALNVLIFLAELITSSLIGDKKNNIPETRSGEDSMITWLLNRNPFKVDTVLKEAQDPGLPRAIIEKLVQTTGDDTACLQLLVCKMSPVVWGIQRSLKQSPQSTAIDKDAPEQGIFQTLFSSLPELDDFLEFSESCERQFPACPLLSLSQLGL